MTNRLTDGLTLLIRCEKERKLENESGLTDRYKYMNRERDREKEKRVKADRTYRQIDSKKAKRVGFSLEASGA